MANCIYVITGKTAHNFFQTIVLYGCNFANGHHMKTLPMTFAYVKFCGQTRRVLRLNECYNSKAITFGHGITYDVRQRWYQVRIIVSVWVIIVDASRWALGPAVLQWLNATHSRQWI
jgi:hypothetical protein